jgi:hypothetical protein
VTRFYLDEMFSPVIAAAGRARRLDITCSHELGRDGMTDESQLRAATQDGRCIVTENHRHFAPLAQQFFARGESHAAIILVPRSISTGPVGVFVDALEHVARRYPDGLPPNTVIWLAPPRR